VKLGDVDVGLVWTVCPRCGGSGRKVVWFRSVVPCDVCRGAGLVKA
jgi:DnaJ-class molecular chaperone